MLKDANLVERSRVVMEKPFGTDLASAIELNDFVHETFRERQIFRIDHFLGKEAAQNILAFRFATGLFEPIWHPRSEERRVGEECVRTGRYRCAPCQQTKNQEQSITIN